MKWKFITKGEWFSLRSDIVNTMEVIGFRGRQIKQLEERLEHTTKRYNLLLDYLDLEYVNERRVSRIKEK